MGQLHDLAVEILSIIMVDVGLNQMIDLAQTCLHFRNLVIQSRMLGLACDKHRIILPNDVAMQDLDQIGLYKAALKAVGLERRILASDCLNPDPNKTCFLPFRRQYRLPSHLPGHCDDCFIVKHQDDIELIRVLPDNTLTWILVRAGGRPNDSSFVVDCQNQNEDKSIVIAYLVHEDAPKATDDNGSGNELAGFSKQMGQIFGVMTLKVIELKFLPNHNALCTRHLDKPLPGIPPYDFSPHIVVRGDHVCVFGGAFKDPIIICNWRLNTGRFLKITCPDDRKIANYLAWGEFHPYKDSIIFRYFYHDNEEENIMLIEVDVPDELDMRPLSSDASFSDPMHLYLNPVIITAPEGHLPKLHREERALNATENGGCSIDFFGSIQRPGRLAEVLRRVTVELPPSKPHSIIRPFYSPPVSLDFDVSRYGLHPGSAITQLHPNRLVHNNAESRRMPFMLCILNQSVRTDDPDVMPHWVRLHIPQAIVEEMHSPTCPHIPWKEDSRYYFDLKRARLLFIFTTGIYCIQY
ncbi:hypothetical protein SISSUDRAFT_1132438 [Sistotremastrum suecicum HHB10207 ss-3]|uniref:Uncharacterized protein n=1 Tax=Sistotremastrum suecicum HHB10207 ss-3 TaxID=1314776 RepID=A0A165YUK4_9AGAM|nr:hypothetical protein SISSUDRAFT_1132438 [Sistotremastrum suecicum HHB10207 ss-3]